jgi:hypothetical protein
MPQTIQKAVFFKSAKNIHFSNLHGLLLLTIWSDGGQIVDVGDGRDSMVLEGVAQLQQGVGVLLLNRSSLFDIIPGRKS